MIGNHLDDYEELYDDVDDYDDEEYDDDIDADDDDEDVEVDEDVDLAEVLRDALADEYAEASLDELDDALDQMFESLSPAEAFNIGKALTQIGQSGLPLAGGAVGTLVGGPVVGTTIGKSLGTAAAKALPGSRPKSSPAGPPTGGSPAAAQALALTQQPQVLQSLLALALGRHGRKSVNGVPVGAVMNMLGSVFGQAAADADALLDGDGLGEEAWDEGEFGESVDLDDPYARAKRCTPGCSTTRAPCSAGQGGHERRRERWPRRRDGRGAVRRHEHRPARGDQDLRTAAQRGRAAFGR